MRHATPALLAALLLSTAAPAQTTPAQSTLAKSPPPASPDPDAEVKTLKERLSDKASDAQRVDNCKVPVDQQGAMKRPGCPAATPVATAPVATAATPPP